MLSPDGSKVATGSNDETARVWTRPRGVPHDPEGHQPCIGAEPRRVRGRDGVVGKTARVCTATGECP